jgi:hypothetical protein
MPISLLSSNFFDKNLVSTASNTPLAPQDFAFPLIVQMFAQPRRSPKPLSLRELADSIEKITGDDEILIKIVLRYLQSLQMHIENRHSLPEGFSTDILIRNRPYSFSARSSEQFQSPQPIIPRSTPSENLGPIESAYLERIQKDLGTLSGLMPVHIPEKNSISKQRMLNWIVGNEAILNEYCEVTLAEWISQRKPETEEME